MTHFNEKTAAVILAGGTSRRMGEDKSLLQLNGITLLEHSTAALQAQINTCLLSANKAYTGPTISNFQRIADEGLNNIGPLAGVLASMAYLRREQSNVQFLLTSPADCPFIPEFYAARMHAAQLNKHAVVVAKYHDREHFLNSLWPVENYDIIHNYVNKGGRSVKGLLSLVDTQICSFDDLIHDPFFNINTPADLTRAKEILNSHSP